MNKSPNLNDDKKSKDDLAQPLTAFCRNLQNLWECWSNRWIYEAGGSVILYVLKYLEYKSKKLCTNFVNKIVNIIWIFTGIWGVGLGG